MFKKEQRYIVIKLNDIEHCLSRRDFTALSMVLDKIEDYREDVGKPKLECVVVESDWKCYDKVWSLVEQDYNEQKHS